MIMSDTRTNDPEAIEREIRQTQEEMSRTVDQIGGQLTMKNMFNALLDKADESNVDARMILDGARRNPVALGLIAAGAIWLVSDRDAKIPSFGDTAKDHGAGRVDSTDYVTHMSSVEQRPEEDHASYQRRRDLARSNYFMLERGHDEDDTSFRGRLDALTDKYRSTRHDWTNAAKEAGKSTGRTAQAVVGATTGATQAVVGSTSRAAQAVVAKAEGLYTQNPIIGGLIAAVVGAVAASALPITDTEQNSLGGIGQKATDALKAGQGQVASKLREQKDQLVEKAEAAIQPSQGQNGDQEADAMSADQTPFIAAR